MESHVFTIKFLHRQFLSITKVCTTTFTANAILANFIEINQRHYHFKLASFGLSTDYNATKFVS